MASGRTEIRATARATKGARGSRRCRFLRFRGRGGAWGWCRSKREASWSQGDPRAWMVLGLLLLGIACLSPFAARAQTDAPAPVMHFCQDPWPPWTVGSLGDTAKEGHAVEIVEAIEARTGWSMELRLLPWARCQAGLESGRHDGALLVNRTQTRESYLLFGRPLIVEPIKLFYDTARFETLDLLHHDSGQPLIFGMVRGTHYFITSVELDRLGMREAYTNTLASAAHHLVAGRVDVIESSLVAGLHALRNAGLPQERIGMVDNPLGAESILRPAFSRHSPFRGRLEELNATISALAQEGTLDRILKDTLVAERP